MKLLRRIDKRGPGDRGRLDILALRFARAVCLDQAGPAAWRALGPAAAKLVRRHLSARPIPLSLDELTDALGRAIARGR